MPFYLSTHYLLDDRSYAGAKFSSATLPPEMFFELTTDGQREQLKEYWQSEDKELCAKVAPGELTGSNKAYVVKSFREQTGPVLDRLPYELVEASEKIDVWALGALAFALLAGEPLIPATRNDDCASGEAMRVVYDWGLKKDVVLTRLEKIGDPAARDLVGKMLQREPSSRPTVESLLSSHSFFNLNSNPELLEELIKVAHDNTRLLKKIDSKVDQVLNQLKAQFQVLSTLLHGVDKLAPKLICFLPVDAIDNSSRKWSSKVDLLNPRSWLNKSVRLFFFDPISLTLAPTNASEEFPNGEGFLLTYPKEWVAKAMPYIKLGLTTLKVAYIAGRLAGFPVPDVAGVVGDWIDSQLGELSALAGEATEWLGEQTKDPALAKSMLKQVDENSRNAISGELEAIKPKDADALCENLRAPLEKSIEELDALLQKDYGDWRQKSGLVLATSHVDGRSEYVLEADKAAFEEKGAELIFTSENNPPLPLTSEEMPPLPRVHTENANTALNEGAPTSATHKKVQQQQNDQDLGTNYHLCACSNNKCALM